MLRSLHVQVELEVVNHTLIRNLEITQDHNFQCCAPVMSLFIIIFNSGLGRSKDKGMIWGLS